MLCPICKYPIKDYVGGGFCEDCSDAIRKGGEEVTPLIVRLLDRCNALEGLLSKANLTIVEMMERGKKVSSFVATSLLVTKRELAHQKRASQVCDGWTGQEHQSANVERVDDEWNLCPDCLDEYNRDMHERDEYGSEE